MKDIKSMTPDELSEFVQSIGEPQYRAAQVFKWLHGGVRDFDEMTNISIKTRSKLREHSFIVTAERAAKQVSKKDGTIKYLFAFADGNCVESVFMRYKHGNSICISTQAGCRMGCGFCASTVGGLIRNLAPSEMLEQVIGIMRDTGEKITNIVLMGTGEPLDNYDNVIRFLKLVNDKNGLNIGMRHISLSTSGLCDKIYRLAEENIPVTLSVSLHAPDDGTRNKIMPVNRKYGVSRLIEACRYYYSRTSRRISFEYALILGVNDTREAALNLSRLLSGFPCHINLIMLNKTEESDFSPPSRDWARKFQGILEQNGLNVTMRRSMGEDISAACGQLRRKAIAANERNGLTT